MRRRSVSWWVVTGAVIALAFLAAPILGMLGRVPWGSLLEVLTSEEIGRALRLTALTSLASTAVAALLGFPLGWTLARGPRAMRRIGRALTTLPLVLPPVVGGVALLLVLGRRGPIGSLLEDLFGIHLFGTGAAVVISQAFIAMPFFVLTLESGIRALDDRLEDVSATLGAAPRMTFLRVVLPALRPAIVAGLVLAWARAIGEFGATITFAGNVPGATQTMPLAIFTELQHDVDGAIGLSLVLILISLTVLITLRDRWIVTR